MNIIELPKKFVYAGDRYEEIYRSSSVLVFQRYNDGSNQKRWMEVFPIRLIDNKEIYPSPNAFKKGWLMKAMDQSKVDVWVERFEDKGVVITKQIEEEDYLQLEGENAIETQPIVEKVEVAVEEKNPEVQPVIENVNIPVSEVTPETVTIVSPESNIVAEIVQTETKVETSVVLETVAIDLNPPVVNDTTIENVIPIVEPPIKKPVKMKKAAQQKFVTKPTPVATVVQKTRNWVFPDGEFTQAQFAEKNNLPPRGTVWAVLDKLTQGKIIQKGFKKLGKSRPSQVFSLASIVQQVATPNPVSVVSDTPVVDPVETVEQPF